jgi:hypothetical protein
LTAGLSEFHANSKALISEVEAEIAKRQAEAGAGAVEDMSGFAFNLVRSRVQKSKLVRCNMPCARFGCTGSCIVKVRAPTDGGGEQVVDVNS